MTSRRHAADDELEALQRRVAHLEAQLRDANEIVQRLTSALRDMADAVVVLDGQGRTVFTNRSYDRNLPVLQHLNLEDETGMPIPDDQRPRRRASRGERFDISFTTIDPLGQRRWYEASARPLGPKPDSGGVLVVHDITDRSLRELQGTFVAMLSHELRTPLTALSGYLELLVRHLSAGSNFDPRALRYAERSLTHIHRFARLVDELFDANRLRTGHMQFRMTDVPLRPIVDEAIAVTQPLAEDRPIVLDAGRADLHVTADAARMQQVVITLLNNAISHASQSPRFEVRMRRRGRRAEIAVRDYGPGLSPSQLARLQQPLDDLSASLGAGGGSGLGLGLYIARSIVDAHGGTLRIESVPPRGATFVVSLPLAR